MTYYLNLSHPQSLTLECTKLDIIYSELLDFDIQAFPETWLTTDILKGDSHGDFMVYVKEGLHYRRRHDLEHIRTECIWIDLINTTKYVLYGGILQTS